MTSVRSHGGAHYKHVDQLVRLRRMRGLGRLMDTAVRIPGTRFSFGADS